MAWNEQQYPVPQNAPRPEMGGGVAPGAVPEAYDGNSLQGQAAPAERNMPKETYLPGANPLNQMAAPPLSPMQPIQSAQPAGVAPMSQQAVVQADDDATGADDVTWINRSKRVIAETRNDPHRQVQLIQHLRAAYLRQRFGRNVHTDEA
jgi:hypothetical protein